MSFWIVVLLVINGINGDGNTFAFTYTDAKNNADWYTIVKTEGYKAVYVYAGDVETYCRGVAGSQASAPCYFSGPNTNSYVYYTDYAKQTAAKYKNDGFEVYLNFDGRIGKGGYVANFSLLSTDAINGMANATANWVCSDPNVQGTGWDVEPYDNDQVPYFEILSGLLAKCNKKYGLFTFPERFNTEMWTKGFGSSGFVLDSSYDLSTPCKCIEPSQQTQLLTNSLMYLRQYADKYSIPYQILLSGSGTTTMYTSYNGGNTCLGGGPVYNYTCPYSMADWMSASIAALDNANVKADPLYMGVGVYDYTDTNNGGFQPSLPPSKVISVLEGSGYFVN